jgi:hypothetical protein
LMPSTSGPSLPFNSASAAAAFSRAAIARAPALIAAGFVDASGQRHSPADVRIKQAEALAEIGRLRGSL